MTSFRASAPLSLMMRLIFLSVFGLACLCSKPVHAGTWYYVVSDNNGSNLSGTSPHGDVDGQSNAGPSDTSTNSTFQDTFTWTLYWVPGNSQDKPPLTVTLNVGPAAYAYAEYGNGQDNPVGNFSVDDGFGDAQTSTMEGSGQFDYDYWWCNEAVVESYGSHLVTVQVDTSKGTFPDTGCHSSIAANSLSFWGKATFPSVTASASVNVTDTVPGAGYDSGLGYGGLGSTAYVGEFVYLDNRALSIAQPITNMKAPAYNTGGSVSKDANGDENFVPQAHTAIAGVMYGDTTFSYNSIIQNPTDPSQTTTVATLNTITFSPSFLGNWHDVTWHDYLGNTEDVPDVVNPNTWSWSPNESSDYWDYGICQMPYAQNFYYDTNGNPQGQDAPQQYPVSYSATDNTDGASATAQYMMLVHDPVEQSYPDYMTRGIENLRMAPNASYVRATQDNESLTVYAEQADSWSVTGSADGPIGDWIAKNLGINLQVSYQYSYNAGVQATLTGINSGYATYLEEFDAYKYHVGKVDTWTTGGYSGTQNYSFKEPDSPCAGYQAHFPPIQLGGGGGH